MEKDLLSTLSTSLSDADVRLLNMLLSNDSFENRITVVDGLISVPMPEMLSDKEMTVFSDSDYAWFITRDTEGGDGESKVVFYRTKQELEELLEREQSQAFESLTDAKPVEDVQQLEREPSEQGDDIIF